MPVFNGKQEEKGMACVELVIKISEERYKGIVENYETFPREWKDWGTGGY